MNNAKSEKSTVIRIGEYYTDRSLRQETVAVNENVAEFLRTDKIHGQSWERRYRRNVYVGFGFDENIAAAKGIYTDSPEERICCQTITEVLHQAIKKLPEYEKKLIILKYFKNKSQTEMVKILGISKSKISRDLQSARNMIKHSMLEIMDS